MLKQQFLDDLTTDSFDILIIDIADVKIYEDTACSSSSLLSRP